MVEINWTPKSLEDINDIAEFISKGSKGFAVIQTERFFDRVEILRTHPLSGRVVPEQENKSIRELIVGNDRIIYEIVDTFRVDILTIHHGARAIRNNPVFRKKRKP